MSTEKPREGVLLQASGKHRVPAGRPKGAQNRLSLHAKDNIAEVFNLMGGTKALMSWAQENPGEFYTKVYTKIIAVQLVGAGPNGEHLITPVLNLSLSEGA